MQNGTVRYYNHLKGFFFLSPDDGSKDVFGHFSVVERAGMLKLQVGQRVSFEAEINDRNGKLAVSKIAPEIASAVDNLQTI
jgi:cold shock protein